MTNDTIRRALEDAKEINDTSVMMDHEVEKNNWLFGFTFKPVTDSNCGWNTPVDRTLPNLLAVLRDLARLHRQVWWEITRSDNQYYAVLKLGETMPQGTTMDACIAASPVWRAAFLADYGIPYEEIEHE